MKLSKRQKKWANENVERLADSIDIWHAIGCPAFHNGGMEQCDCELPGIICSLQDEANCKAGIFKRKPRIYE